MCISNYHLTAATNVCALNTTENDTDQFHLGITDAVAFTAIPNEGFYADSKYTCPYNFAYDGVTANKCLEIFPNRINGCE
jgi:hypothetical protein